MKLGTTLVLLIGALGVGAAAFWLVWVDGSPEAGVEELPVLTAEAPALVTEEIALEDFSSIAVSRFGPDMKSKEVWKYERRRDGWWSVGWGEQPFPADASALREVISKVRSVRVARAGYAEASLQALERLDQPGSAGEAVKVGDRFARPGDIHLSRAQSGGSEDAGKPGYSFQLGPRFGAGLGGINGALAGKPVLGSHDATVSDELHELVEGWDWAAMLSRELRWPGYASAKRIMLRHPRGSMVLERDGGRWEVRETGGVEIIRSSVDDEWSRPEASQQATQPAAGGLSWERVDRQRVQRFLGSLNGLRVAEFVPDVSWGDEAVGLSDVGGAGAWELKIDGRVLRVGRPATEDGSLWFASYHEESPAGREGLPVVFLLSREDVGRLNVTREWFLRTPSEE
ncbi:MAG: hypothetical protein AAF750_19055 [Planctomycetota bacterium]